MSMRTEIGRFFWFVAGTWGPLALRAFGLTATVAGMAKGRIIIGNRLTEPSLEIFS